MNLSLILAGSVATIVFASTSVAIASIIGGGLIAAGVINKLRGY